MKHPYRPPLFAAVLAVALAIPLPSVAKSKDHGEHRGGSHSSVGGGGRSNSTNHGSARGGGRQSDSRGDHGSTRGFGSRGSNRGDVRNRDQRSGSRADTRWRDASRSGRIVRDGRTHYREGRHHDGDHRPRYSSRTRYRHGGPIYTSHHPRNYYTGHFHRPHFAYRSGFSIGFVISSVPSYRYDYFDPYCNLSFRHLATYYDHCYDLGHQEVILVVDANGGYPIATCVYSDGAWVVDDRHDDRYDDRY